jgi:hypothetical protein
MSLSTECTYVVVLEFADDEVRSTPMRRDRTKQWIETKKKQYKRLLARKPYRIYLLTRGINQDRHG